MAALSSPGILRNFTAEDFGDAFPTPATSVTAGQPGSLSAGATQPEDLASLKADPNIGDGTANGAAWTGGDYIDLEDGTTAYWDGSAWQAGTAP